MKHTSEKPVVTTVVLSALVSGLALVSGMQAASVVARGLSMQFPDSWQQETPSSSMRAAQARVPGTGGDGQFTVFHFGEGGGGGVEPNISRWMGLMDLGGSTPERTQLSAGDLTIHFVDAAGTLLASRIGSFPQTDQPDYRLFGAVIEGSGGPWYLRLVGPDATLQEQRAGFMAMLEGLER